MRIIRPIFLSLIICFSVTALSQNGGGESLYPDHDKLERLKDQYRRCVKKKGADLMSVSDFSTAVKYAPVACRRNYFAIRMFLFGSAFKAEVSHELIASVEAGIEIEMINHLLELALKQKR